MSDRPIDHSMRPAIGEQLPVLLIERPVLRHGIYD
jgi:hypothetical protein